MTQIQSKLLIWHHEVTGYLMKRFLFLYKCSLQRSPTKLVFSNVYYIQVKVRIRDKVKIFEATLNFSSE